MIERLRNDTKKVDFISRAAVVKYLEDCSGGYDYIETEKEGAINDINAIPAADVRPVVAAHWEWDENGMDWNLGAWRCSHCRCKAETWWATDKHNPLRCAGSHFCGNCGADMRSVYKPGSKEAWQSLQKAQEDFRKTAQVMADMREVKTDEL